MKQEDHRKFINVLLMPIDKILFKSTFADLYYKFIHLK